MANAMTIDLEDWFCVANIQRVISQSDWINCESRILNNTKKVLSILSQHQTKATFFVLGWIAEHVPEVVYLIDESGHEIASHGYGHRLLTQCTPDEFKIDLSRSLEILHNLTQQPIRGFRAPSFTITRKTFWAFDVLKEFGIQYDSSVFPVGFHPDYGMKDAPINPYQIENGIIELPLSVVELGGRRIPFSGGGYFRIFPYTCTRWGLRKVNEQSRPIIFYFHPWEIDPDQPKVKLPFTKRIRHYTNLDKTEKRLHRLLSDFSFTTCKDVLGL